MDFRSKIIPNASIHRGRRPKKAYDELKKKIDEYDKSFIIKKKNNDEEHYVDEIKLTFGN